jgi:putative ABC transport system permease protein
MFRYYLQLGLRSLRRSPTLTTLMVVGIALGIAATMTSLTVFHLMGSDPIPWKSSRLFHVQLDNWDPNQGWDDEGSPPDQVTHRDAVALMQAARADRQVAMYRISLPIQPVNPEVKPFQALGRATYADFFAMFDTPFEYGGGWQRAQDDGHARVVVLSRETNEKLFGGEDSVGKTVRMNDVDYAVSGVLDEWQPRVKFYDLTSGALDEAEDFYVPMTTAIEFQTSSAGNNNCWANSEPGWEAYLESECVWHQFWVELDRPGKVAAYKTFLDNYVTEQKSLGRFQRPLNNRLLDVNDWLASQKVVPRDVQIQVWLSFAFLAVCLVNTIGLLLAKFMRKAAEVGLRRALGASKRELFAQHLVEAGVIGISGGALGLVLTGFGLWLVRTLYNGFGTVAHLDWTMTAVTVVLAVVTAVLAGIYPTWRACQIAPATQLKTQ